MKPTNWFCQKKTRATIFDHSYSVLLLKRHFDPRRNINWLKIRTVHREKELVKARRKHRDHSRALRKFRLTRFGWERLRAGRTSGQKLRNKTFKGRKELRKITFVKRADIKKLQVLLPNHKLRIRDAPRDNNPNILKSRKILPGHFG